MIDTKGLLALGLSVFLLTGPAAAQRGNADFAKGRLFPAQLIQQHRAELALTREQNVRIRDVISELQGTVSALQWDMAGLVTDLQALLDGDTVDEEAVTVTAQELMALENTVKVEQLRMLVRVRNVLTAEQIEYLRALQ